jgi:hypothetical protein
MLTFEYYTVQSVVSIGIFGKFLFFFNFLVTESLAIVEIGGLHSSKSCEYWNFQ